MTEKEFQLLQQIAKDTSEIRTLVGEHTNQIKSLFDITANHAHTITVIGTKQELCQRRNDPGNKSERMGVWVAIVAAVVSLVGWLVNCFK